MERVRLKLGRGSPARVGALLDQWLERLVLTGRSPIRPNTPSMGILAGGTRCQNGGRRWGSHPPTCAWHGGLKRGDLSAMGMGRSDYETFMAQEPQDQRNAFRVLARSGDLPSELLMAGEHVPAETVAILRKSIVDNSAALINSISQG